MKKKTVKKSTMLNLRGFLILISFGVWVTLMMEIKENFDTLKDAIMAYGSNTLLMIIVTYIILVILGLFIEGESAE
jgi:TRAP-type C4-dicarboxylate transport system permease large subunit